jgi:hypothetical protein
MDLYAYVLSSDEQIHGYVTKHYGDPPRLRGIRHMKFETPDHCEGDGVQAEMFARHCGEDVIYIHTRCGSARWGDDDPDANYVYFGADNWEKANSDTFIESCNDEFDGTYRDHYFKAAPGEDYDELCKLFEDIEASKNEKEGSGE